MIETITSELTPLSKLSTEQFLAALDTNKASGLAKLYGVTVSTIHYYKMKAKGIKRELSIGQLEAVLAAKQARAEKQATRAATNGVAAEAAKAERQAARLVRAQETAARRQELLDQIAAFSPAQPVAV